MDSTPEISWQIIGSKNPQFLFVGGIHGDEYETSEIFAQETQNGLNISRIQVLNECPEATLERKRKFDHPSGQIDLNRQFTLDSTEKNWSDIFYQISLPEAQRLLYLVKDHPEIQYVFSFHEDPEEEKRFYFYDCLYDENADEEKESIGILKKKMASVLIEKGFDLFNGIDDINDPALGYSALEGYIYQPIINKNGIRNYDTTFESALAEVGGKGINKVQRSFVFEIPGKMTHEKKAIMLQIIRDEFIVPFSEAKSIELHKK